MLTLGGITPVRSRMVAVLSVCRYAPRVTVRARITVVARLLTVPVSMCVHEGGALSTVRQWHPARRRQAVVGWRRSARAHLPTPSLEGGRIDRGRCAAQRVSHPQLR